MSTSIDGEGLYVLNIDETANDNSKTFSCPSGARWLLLWIWIELNTSGDVGNRLITLRLRDTGDDIIYGCRAPTVTAGSSAELTYAPNLTRETALTSGSAFLPIPSKTILPENYDYTVGDEANISATDDMIIQSPVMEWVQD